MVVSLANVRSHSAFVGRLVVVPDRNIRHGCAFDCCAKVRSTKRDGTTAIDAPFIMVSLVG